MKPTDIITTEKVKKYYKTWWWLLAIPSIIGFIGGILGEGDTSKAGYIFGIACTLLTISGIAFNFWKAKQAEKKD